MKKKIMRGKEKGRRRRGRAEEEGVKNLRRVRYPTLNRERYAQIRIDRVRYPLIGGDLGGL